MKKAYFDYIVIGAGPSGIQTGYFLQKKNLDYCILERAAVTGSFFTKYPRKRSLISINKVFTGYTDPEVNLRWDWNSLLCDNPELLFKNYSKDYFPHSDDLVRYLQDFSAHYKLNIKYNSEAEHIVKNEDGLFQIRTGDLLYECKNLIVATGVPNQFVPDIEGIEDCDFYSDCSIVPEDYENKKVLIIGKGNSGFEIADLLMSATSTTHLLSPNVVVFAWKTHYVGHLRAVNNNLLDTYLLKSQNVLLNADIKKIKKQENGKYVVSVDYTKVRNGETEDLEYDNIIVSCGFKMDNSFFGAEIKPTMAHRDKFPELTCEWESTNVANLYFAGVLSHSRDFKKTTSGFIHGYRYNCDALVQILNKKNNGEDFSAINVPDIDAKKITDLVVEKINRSSALWQQFGFLGDILIINKETKAAKYLNALPVDYVHEFLCKEEEDYLIFTLEYGTRPFNPFSSDVERINRFDSDNANDSDFLHPVIRRFSKGTLIAEKHLIEDLAGEFMRREHVEPLFEFLNVQLYDILPQVEVESTIPQ